MKMAEESSGLGMSHSLEKKKRDILLSTKRTWLPLDEQQPPAPREEGWHSPIPEIENSRQESIQQWLDSGFFITAQGNLQPAIDQTDSLNKQGVDPETVQDYMRSLQQFSETPALSRGTSFNSCPSVPSIPKSIPEWLEFWQKDPVEILLDLGFGAEEPDICTKIPARFLRGSSAAKGINIREFLEAHKQRMDLETPNLYGRFRQLEVLDHVTNAFSSLLNNVNSLQREGEGNAQAENPKLAQVRVNQDRRKRLGQLLRRASKQTVRRDCVQGRAETLRVKEDLLPTPGEPDKCPSLQSSRMNVADHSHLSPLTEEQPPVASNKLASHEASPSAPGKSGPPLSSMAFKKPALPCTPEGSARDRGFQEKGPLLSHRLRQVVHMDGKSPDSFEMEEVQSFEEEPGNPLEGTLGTVGAGVTRASSCQSDSSGFLEEPSEPFPLQISPLLTNQNLSCGRQEAETPSLGSLHHHPQEPTEDTSQCIVNLPILNQGQSNLKEEIFACVEKDYSLSAKQSTQKGFPKETSTREDLERKENPMWNFSPSPHTNYQVDGGTITSKYDYPVGFTVAHIVEVKTDCLEAEEPLVFVAQSPSIMGSGCDKDVSIHVDHCQSGSEVLRDEKAGQQDPNISQLRSLSESGMLTTPREGFPTQTELTHPLGVLDEVSKTYISNSDDIAGYMHLSTPGLSASGKASSKSGAKVGEFILDTETNANGFRSVTIQMPSKLVSGIHSTTSGEGPRENTLDPLLIPSKFYKSEAFLPSEPAIESRERQTKETSVQTEKKELGFQSLCPALSCCSVTHRRHHLTQSVSLDSGSLGIHQPTSDSKVAVHGTQCKHGSCYCYCCCCWHHHHPCDWQHPGLASSLFQHHLQVQLTKTVKILQDAVVRELSLSTVQNVEIWRTVCQSFREHSEEIGRHLTKQQAYVFSDMSEEGREEMRQLHNLRQDLQQQVAELEFQLSDRARQIREGMLLFDQLLEEQSQLCSELGLTDWGEGSEPNFHTDLDIHETVSPRAPSPTIEGQGTPLPEQTRTCALSSPTSEGSPEMALPSPTLAEPDLTASSASWDQRVSGEEKRGFNQSRMDLKGFLCKMKKTFKSSFGNEAADGQN
ncbi:protein ITPRID1 isoform X2 [Dromiciops gliroides]|uniref:protein ITPRID1 isoform X2 n=1 Tax=Dromiciops gliroides TaxID=33562 RepID=UPI001CC64012|nr:protein ITPRID1 isoform X2 [Dromiciops gliroides]